MATETKDETIKFMNQEVEAYLVHENIGNQKIIYKKTRKRNVEPEALYVEVTLKVPMEFLKGKCLYEGFKGMFWYIDPIEPKKED